MKRIYKEVDLKNMVSGSPLKGLWNLMYGFRGIYIVAALCLAVGALAKTATFLLLGFFIDSVLAKKLYSDYIALFAAGFVGLTMIQAATSFFQGKLAARASEGSTARIRNKLYDHIQRLSFSYHDKTMTGELIERVTSDVETINRFLTEQATQIGRISATFIFNFMAILSLNIHLGFLSIAILPFILFISLWFFRKITTAFGAYQEQEAKLSSTLQENISSVRVVRAFARKDFEIEKFEKVNFEKLKKGKKLLFFHTLFWPLSDMLCIAQTLVVFSIGGYMAISGTITPGIFIAVIELLANIIWPIREIGRTIVESSKAMVSYRRIAEIFKETPEDFEAAGENRWQIKKGEVCFQNVSFEYFKGEKVLNDVSFNGRPGELIAVLGATGSGKSSFVNLIPRFYDCTRGEIKIDGIPIREYPLEKLREQIGMVEQEPFLFSSTIRENIRFGARGEVTDEDIHRAAKAAAVHDVILGFPKGYDTLVGEKGVTLSGGQKQRLAIARTILKDPRILILDDATSSVDSQTESTIQEALEELMKGRSSFIIAHRIDTVKKADKIVVLDKGSVIQSGTHESLVRENGFYRKIFLTQQEEDMTNRDLKC